jgi:hypothetical protein
VSAVPHLRVVDIESGEVHVNCPDGCDAVEVRRAVEARAAIAEKLRVVDGRKDAA